MIDLYIRYLKTKITPQRLNILGLIFGMMGVVVIFLYGPPQPNLEPGVGIGLEDGTPLADGQTVAEHNAEVLKLKECHSLMSKAGLVLIFIGFGLQLWATCSSGQKSRPNANQL